MRSAEIAIYFSMLVSCATVPGSVVSAGAALSGGAAWAEDAVATAPDSKPVVGTEQTQTPQQKKECGPMDESELKKKLTPEQFEITQRNGTERPFQNAYWDNHEPGIYVDVVSGEALFSSTDKFDSGTGWPSFSQPIDKSMVVEVKDQSHGMVRTEVRSKGANSHLGHLFPDGPTPTGDRYCINSGSLRFIPVSKLDAEGFGAYKTLFDKKK